MTHASAEGPLWSQEHIYGLEEPDGREWQRVLVRTVALRQLSDLSITPLMALGRCELENMLLFYKC